MKNYDVLIIGGGTAGCACAWNCGKLGLKTLLIEKSEQLGGAMTAGLVVPMMNTGKNQINTDFYHNLVLEMRNIGGQINYLGNPGWLNPELLKIVLDKMLTKNDVEILFNTEVINAKIFNNLIEHAEINTNILSTYSYTIDGNNILLDSSKMLLEHTYARYYVDATGDANFSQKINCKILKNNDEIQPMSLRFIMSGIDLEVLGKFLLEKDVNRDVTTVEHINGQVHLSTAYTWDADKHWALEDLFNDAVDKKCLKDTDRNYFQIFTIAGMPNSVAFNCPRIIEKLDSTDCYDRSIALLEGRQAILRISNFCKKYLPGFENAFISNIAKSIGVRSSYRVKGKYIYTIEDLRSGKKFPSPAVVSNYPVDVHSGKKDSSILEENGEYQLPIESLMSYDYDNLYMAGRNLSTDYLAQGALRVQASCFSMGEAVAKHIKSRIS